MANKPTTASTAQSGLAIMRCGARGAEIASPAQRADVDGLYTSLARARRVILSATPATFTQAQAQTALAGIIGQCLSQLERYPQRTHTLAAWSRLMARYAELVARDNAQLAMTEPAWRGLFQAAHVQSGEVRSWCLAATHAAHEPKRPKQAQAKRQPAPQGSKVTTTINSAGMRGSLRIHGGY